MRIEHRKSSRTHQKSQVLRVYCSTAIVSVLSCLFVSIGYTAEPSAELDSRVAALRAEVNALVGEEHFEKLSPMDKLYVFIESGTYYPLS